MLWTWKGWRQCHYGQCLNIGVAESLVDPSAVLTTARETYRTFPFSEDVVIGYTLCTGYRVV